MSVKTTVAALALIAVAGAASAASVNPGTAQFSQKLGVEPGSLSLSQLIRLDDAIKNNDREAQRFILSQSAVDSVAGNDQLAALAGVEPGKYSATELVRLKAAQREGDRETVAYILSGANRATPAGAGVVTPAKVRLAAKVGVNPADHSLAELVALQPQPNN